MSIGRHLRISFSRLTAILLLYSLCSFASPPQNFKHDGALLPPDHLSEEDIAGDAGYTRLHQATLQGDLETVRKLLREGADPNAAPKRGGTALSFAMRSTSGADRVALAKILIRAGAHPNYPDYLGHQPLHWAVLRQDMDSIEFLLAHGADVHYRCYEGTPLHIALECKYTDKAVDEQGKLFDEPEAIHWKRHIRVAKVLLAAGANLEAGYHSPFGFTRPIDSRYMMTRKGDMLELRQAYRQVEPRLSLYPGEDINAPANRSWSRLHYAAMDGHIDIARNLVHLGAEVDICAERGRSPLSRAADAAVARLLLDKGADPNHGRKYGLSPLIYQSIKGNEEVVRLLLRRGARISTTDTQNMSALHYAARYKHPEVVRILLENGANVDGRRANGQTPLLMAAGAFNSRSAELLLSYGADVNVADNKGYTPLHRAILNPGYYGTMNVILQYEPDPWAVNEDGKTPRDIAEERGYTNQVQALLGYERRWEKKKRQDPP